MSRVGLAMCVPSLSDNTSGRAAERSRTPSCGGEGSYSEPTAVVDGGTIMGECDLTPLIRPKWNTILGERKGKGNE